MRPPVGPLPDFLRPISGPPRRAHLVGIGGSGMRVLAEVLLAAGWRLSGSDQQGDGNLPRALEAQTAVGHRADNVPAEADVVIYSRAIEPENVELRQAAELGIPCISYPQALGRIMAGRLGVAVAGTHGKSTTVAMLGEILVRAGLDPTIVGGGAPLGGWSGGRGGRGELMVAEACEYRRSFLELSPQIAAVLNIEPDHFDCYPTLDALCEAFREFVARIPRGRTVLVNADCRQAAAVGRGLDATVATFGLGPGGDWQAANLSSRRGRYRFAIEHRGRRVAEAELKVPGRHNVANALAAAALASLAGASAEAIAGGLESFRGLQRRLEEVARPRGVTVIDDYAHHPTELRAGLQAVREMYPGKKIWCVFQPHQVSRTRHLLDGLAAALDNADRVVVTDIFPAREEAPAGAVTAAELAARVRSRGGWVLDAHGLEGLGRRLAGLVPSGEVLMTIGAGNVRKVCDEFIDGLRSDSAAA